LSCHVPVVGEESHRDAIAADGFQRFCRAE
jgi:hypothetical protein